MKKSVQVNIRVEKCLFDELKRLVEKGKVTMTDVFYMGAWSALAKHSPKSFKRILKAVEKAKKLNKRPGRPPKRRKAR